MVTLTAVLDANDWVFVRGMTGDGSFDPVGPRATSVKLTTTDGSDHYVGAYSRSPSKAILRAYFDGLANSVVDIGYVVTVQAYCFGKPFDIKLLPAFGQQSRYTVESQFLDFMGPFDARARFGNPQLGDRPADAPLYPFNGFLGSASNNFWGVFWHPMPNGSLRRPANTPPPSNSRPAGITTNVSAQAASLRAVIRPFMMVAGDLAEICQPEFAAFDGTVDAAPIDASSLYAGVRALYTSQFGEDPPTIVDAKVAGAYLILIAADNSAIIVLQGARKNQNQKDVYPLTLWEVDHDTFERLEHQVANRTLSGLDTWMAAQYPNAQVTTLQMQGRGSRPLEGPATLGMMVGQPTFSLDYSATLVGWQPGRTRNAPLSSPIPHSTVSTRFDWVYDPFGESFDLVVNPPRAPTSIPPVGQFWTLYQQALFGSAVSTDTPDLSPFTLAGAPWLDDAPKTPATPVRSYPS